MHTPSRHRPLTEGTEGQWVGDCAEATPVLVPLLSLGRRVVATPVAGEPAGTVMIAPANVAEYVEALATFVLRSR